MTVLSERPCAPTDDMMPHFIVWALEKATGEDWQLKLPGYMEVLQRARKGQSTTDDMIWTVDTINAALEKTGCWLDVRRGFVDD